MFKLKDVSKFYYNKGNISTGFTKVNLSLDLGEFVVITGESGSGKSTLLNVLSGMDSYEEGEMYINGQETSHYQESEFEEYRKKYISNIFQNFNLVNSYTVYQNVELVLLINGYKRKEVKKRILKILKEVGLLEFQNTKASKLSGGQKQRVAIARTLAKETPIIIADEPTGNLDKASAKSVLSLLHNIAKDKLVVIVTHNYEQVEPYATRKIKMHDGKISEDKQITKIEEKRAVEDILLKNITPLNKLRLGLRNTFNIFPKLTLLLLVFLFVISSFLLEYSSFKKLEYTESTIGYNDNFKNLDDKRIIIKNKNNEVFTDEDYLKIEDLPNINYLVKEDRILDNTISLVSSDQYLYGNMSNISLLQDENLDHGRMPEKKGELIISGNKNDYHLSYNLDKTFETTFQIYDMTNYVNDQTYKIVGVKYLETSLSAYYGEYYFYATDESLEHVKELSDKQTSNINVIINNKSYKSYEQYMDIRTSESVPEGAIYVNTNLDYACANYNCLNKEIKLINNTIYYEKDIVLKVSKKYTKNNFKTTLNSDNYEDGQYFMYVNPNDYKRLFSQQHYQSSVFVNDSLLIKQTNKDLQELGYETLMIKDAIINHGREGVQVVKIINLVVTTILLTVMFFISYFIIKIILKSRNIYFSIIRILGASKEVSKKLLDIELFTVMNMAYFMIILLIYLVSKNILNIELIKGLIPYIKVTDYILVYIIALAMTKLTSNRFARSIFKKSAIKTINEVV